MASANMYLNIKPILPFLVLCALLCVGFSFGNQIVHRQDRMSDVVRDRVAKQGHILEDATSASESMTTPPPPAAMEESTATPTTTTSFNPYSLENTSRAHRKALRLARKGKSRRKRRGCKCVGRYMQDVQKLIDSKIKEFKDFYLIPKLKESNSQRMFDNLLRLSGDVDATKNDLNLLSESVTELLRNFQGTQRELDLTSRHVNRLTSVVANLSNHMDNMEHRLSNTGIKASRIRARHSHDMASSKIETSTQVKPLPTQCDDAYKSGHVQILGEYYIMMKPRGAAHAFKALCRMVNNSGWTVIQRRQDGSVDFYRNWDDYRVGFGSLEGEFWLGNDNIHYLTTQEDTMLRIEMESWSGEKYYAVYDHFRIDGARQHYRLHISGYHGDAGDAMNSVWENHDGRPFSTKDKDNDERYYDSCAQHYQGAWWFNNCFEAHLNGKYYTKGFHKNYFQRDGIQWNTIHMYSSLKAVQMMVKPVDKPAKTG